MGEDDSLLELLEIFMDMVEKQDEIIWRLGRIVKRQATDLRLMKNDEEFSDENLDEDIAIADETMEQYKAMKSELEP